MKLEKVAWKSLNNVTTIFWGRGGSYNRTLSWYGGWFCAILQSYEVWYVCKRAFLTLSLRRLPI